MLLIQSATVWLLHFLSYFFYSIFNCLKISYVVGYYFSPLKAGILSVSFNLYSVHLDVGIAHDLFI